MTGLTGLTVWGETVKKVKTVRTKNYMSVLPLLPVLFTPISLKNPPRIIAWREKMKKILFYILYKQIYEETNYSNGTDNKFNFL